MKIMQLALAAFVFAGLATSASAEDKKPDLKKQLVGKWEATKVPENSIPVGATVEFLADGKMKVVAGDLNADGTYTIDGDNKFTAKITIGGDEKTHKITVKKITDKELETTDDESHEISWKKVK